MIFDHGAWASADDGTLQAVFSMDMFNWQGSASARSSDRIVSPHFWVYWVVMIPLTVLVALLWRVWWSWEKQNFDEDVRMEIRNIEEPTPWPPSKEKTRREVLEELEHESRRYSMKRLTPAHYRQHYRFDEAALG